MVTFTRGNLLESEAEALVNTVNTYGVMGKGIALMFKEAFPENFEAYEAACKAKEVEVGRVFVTERDTLMGPKWIVNFPTKKHWRHPSKLEWIEEGLRDLRRVIEERGIRSIALPPLGSGNGKLEWSEVRPLIEGVLGDLEGVEVTVFEPTAKYQNVAKRDGVKKLTPARALVAELVRRYSVLGMECSLVEVQKLSYFLEGMIVAAGLPNVLDLRFTTNRYGPYADRLRHLLNGLDGSYLHCDKRLGDAEPFDVIRFEDSKRDVVATFLKTVDDAKQYLDALERTTELIDGFESPLGMELLATVDWLLQHEGVRPRPEAVRAEIRNWPGGEGSGRRKERLFDDRMLLLAIDRLTASNGGHLSERRRA
jgi:O-acetyl-ADP-ribose deacetylase (regulator of RNase III)